MRVRVGAEGYLDFAVADRLLSHYDHVAIPTIGPNDRTRLLRAVGRIARSGGDETWFVLCDLDQDECAPSFIEQALPDTPPQLCLRVAVREVESWLLADPGLARFLRIPETLIPNDPEELATPKRYVVDAARASTSRQIRSAVTPSTRSKNPIGRRYTPTLIDFVRDHWDPERAAERSDSLRRAMGAVARLAGG